MKHLMMLAAAAAMATPVHADDYKLTVEQAIGVGNALRSLSVKPDGAPLPPGTYKFGGRILMRLATIQQKTDGVKRAYEEVVRASIKAEFGDDDPAKMAADPKRSDEYREKNDRFHATVKAAVGAPANVSLGLIRQDELCLDAKPPECPQANPISVEVLTLLLPVMDPTP